MFFTEEDYKKIEQYLINCGVKDSCLEGAVLPFQGNEKITIVQDGKNRTLYFRELIEALKHSKAALSDLYNVTDHAKEKYITLKKAIELVPYKARKLGQIITFLNPDSKWELYQFTGASILQWNELSLWNDLFNLDEYIVKSILPDEEDLTKSEPNGNGNSYLSLKDREYNPAEFSGLGRVILRKNIMEVESEEYGKVKKNVLLQDMINKPNTIYEIRYDFDLNNQEITIPEGCVLDFQGGSFSNGIVNFNYSQINTINNGILINIKIQNIEYVLIDWFISKQNLENDISSIINNINIKNINIQFTKKQYKLSCSNLILEKNLIINGINRNNTTIIINPSNRDSKFLLGFKWGVKIYNITIELNDTNYTNDIIRLSNDFSELGDSASPNWGLKNIAIITKWITADLSKYKATGINFLFREYNDFGIKNNCLELSYQRTFNNILLKYLNKGINIFIKQDSKNPESKLWCNSILFDNLEIWAHYGIYWYQYGVDSDTTRFTFDHIMYQGSGDQNFGLYTETNFNSIFLLNYNNWDSIYDGSLNGEGYLYVSYAGSSAKIQNGSYFLNKGNATIIDVSDYNRTNLYLKSTNYDAYTGKGTGVIKKQNNSLVYQPDQFFKNKIVFTPTTAHDLDESFESYNYSENKIYEKISKLDKNTPIKDLASTFLEGSRIINIYSKYQDTMTGKYYLIDNYAFPLITSTYKQFLLPYNMLYIVKKLNFNLKNHCYYDIKFNIILNKPLKSISVTCLNIFNPIADIYDNENGLFTIVESIAFIDTMRLRIKTHEHNVTTASLAFLFKINNEEINNIFIKDIQIQEITLLQNYIADSPIDYPKDSSQTVLKNPYKGEHIYSTKYNKPIWYNGDNWVDCFGATPDKNNGNYSNKPNNPPIGFAYFCTDKQTTEGTTNGIMIYHKGNNVWVDALGRVVN